MKKLIIVALASAVSGCVTTSMTGYADRNLPNNPIQHVAAYVAAPGPLAASIQASIQDEAKKRGVVADDAFSIFPPTRTYSNEEIRRDLAARGIDGVLVINVGDTGVIREYAGTYFSGQYSGTTSLDGSISRVGNTANLSMNGISSGQMTATATPINRYSRQTNFSAQLIEPSSSRKLWVGGGQVNAGGLLFVGNGVSASSSISAIFDDLQAKGIISSSS